MTMMPTAEEAARALTATMRELTRHSRLPFRQILAELIGAKPSAADLQAFAAKYPDKWAQALTMMANLSGYEKGLIELNVYNIGNMSDVQLLAELAAGEGELAKLGLRRAPVTIDQPPIAAGGPSAPPIEKESEAPRPAAERGPDGGYVDPTEAV